MTDSILEFKTFDLASAAEMTGAPSADWLMRKIRAGAFTGRKAGRNWRMTESDMAEAVEYMKRAAKPTAVAAEQTAPSATPPRTGLTQRARRNLARTA